MNNEEIFNEFIHYLNNDIQSKDFLTYQEQDEWKDYLERIINNCTKEKDKEIARLNKIIDEIEKVINECSILGEYGTSRMFIEKDYLLNKLKELKGEE